MLGAGLLCERDRLALGAGMAGVWQAGDGVKLVIVEGERGRWRENGRTLVLRAGVL